MIIHIHKWEEKEIELYGNTETYRKCKTCNKFQKWSATPGYSGDWINAFEYDCGLAHKAFARFNDPNAHFHLTRSELEFIKGDPKRTAETLLEAKDCPECKALWEKTLCAHVHLTKEKIEAMKDNKDSEKIAEAILDAEKCTICNEVWQNVLSNNILHPV